MSLVVKRQLRWLITGKGLPMSGREIGKSWTIEETTAKIFKGLLSPEQKLYAVEVGYGKTVAAWRHTGVEIIELYSTRGSKDEKGVA